MCLYAKNKDGYVSEEPIKCYKVYRRRSDGGMESFYRFNIVHLKEGDEVVAEGEAEFTRSPAYGNYFELGRGFIHAVKEKCITLLVPEFMCEQVQEIIRQIYTINKDHQIKCIDDSLCEIVRYLKGLHLCEMEIPAGERYWVEEYYAGMLGEGDVCAQRMIFKKEFEINKKSEILSLIWEIYSDSFTENANETVRNLIEEYKAKGE